MHKEKQINFIFFVFIGFFSIYAAIHSPFVNALQIKPIKDNESQLVKVSSKEQSRIFVKNDRILVIRGLDGAYNLKKDDKLGEIYIQPTSAYQNKTFNLFITTEQGRTYNLLINPIDSPGETIELKPLSPVRTLSSQWEKESPYSQTLIKLIRAMSNGTQPDGYSIIRLGKTKPKRVPIRSSTFSVRLLALYRGNRLRGEVWAVKNESQKNTYINPQDFYQDNVLAISLQNEGLQKNEETILYRVVNDE